MSTEMRRWNEAVDTAWHEKALCRTEKVSTEVWRLFEPVGLDEDKPDAWARARLGVEAFCSVCPVAAACAAEGAEHEYEGLWGGQFRERRGIIDLDTGMVERGDLVEVDPDDLDELDLDDEDEDETAPDMPADMPVEPDPIELPEPEDDPEPAPRVVTRRPRRAGLRRPRRHRDPRVGVQLSLADLPAPRRRRSPGRAPNDVPAGALVAV